MNEGTQFELALQMAKNVVRKQLAYMAAEVDWLKTSEGDEAVCKICILAVAGFLTNMEPDTAIAYAVKAYSEHLDADT